MARSLALALAAGSLACLPPASLPPAPAVAAESAQTPAPELGSCRALIGERHEGRFVTRELRWDARGIHEASRAGLLLGDAEGLFELSLERRALDPSELYGDAEVRCEEPALMLRKLPDGVARPLLTTRPTCVGTVDGEQFELRTSLQVVSALGPFLGWREQIEGSGAERASRVRYGTTDVRDARALAASEWLLEAPRSIESNFRPDTDEMIGRSCKQRDLPGTTAAIEGFAIRWTDTEGSRLQLAYRCCDGRSCELDDPVPRLDPELATRLPDPDRLLHSPYGCGSIGLNGQLRTRDGVAIGRVELDPKKVIGAVFLPADHPFKLDW
ncbi:MAG: hypothetical protein R6X02_10575 [Enhygromyxa sp.]